MVKSTEPRPVRRRSRKPGEAPRALMMIVKMVTLEMTATMPTLRLKDTG